MAQGSIITGVWLCKCGLLFSWDSHHQKAVYMVIDVETKKELKIEKPICGNDHGPVECPECQGSALENIKD